MNSMIEPKTLIWNGKVTAQDGCQWTTYLDPRAEDASARHDLAFEVINSGASIIDQHQKSKFLADRGCRIALLWHLEMFGASDTLFKDAALKLGVHIPDPEFDNNLSIPPEIIHVTLHFTAFHEHRYIKY